VAASLGSFKELISALGAQTMLPWLEKVGTGSAVYVMCAEALQTAGKAREDVSTA